MACFLPAGAATTYAVTANPSPGYANTPVQVTVTPNGVATGGITVTPSGAGLSSGAAQTATFSNSSTPVVLTFVPTVTGTLTLTGTNTAGLTDASPVTDTIGTLSTVYVAAFGKTQGTTGSATSAPINTNGCNLLVVTVSAAGATTLTDSAGNTWTAGTATSNGSNRVQIYYCYNPTTSASHTFTVTGSLTYPTISYYACANYNGATPTQAAGGIAFSALSVQPGSLTPAQNGALLVAALNQGVTTAQTISIDSGFASDFANYVSGISVGGGSGYLLQSSAAAVNPTMSWPTTTGNAAAAMMSFLPAVTGASTYAITASPSPGYLGVPVVVTVTPNGTTTGTITITPSGCGLSTPQTLTFSGGASSQTLAFIPTIAGTLTLTGTNTAGLTNPSAITDTIGAITAPTSTTIYFSPGNWFSNGSGSFQSNNAFPGSTYAISNNPGAYLKTVATSTGSGTLSLVVDSSILLGITGGNTPQIAWSIDSGIWQTSQLTYSASAATISLATGLAGGAHTLELYFQSVNLSGSLSMGDRWNNPATDFAGVKVWGLVTDAGSTLSAPTVFSKRAVWFGDSSLEAAQNVSSSLGVAGQDAGQSFAYTARYGLGAELGVVGFSTQGISQGGYGNVPALYNAIVSASGWANYFSGTSRTAQPLDYIICSHSINGTPTSAQVQALVAQMRAAYPVAKIVMCAGWNLVNASAISSGVAAYQAANPSDTNVYYVTPGTLPNGGYTNNGNPNHPTLRADALIAAAYAGAIQAAITSSGGGGGGSAGGTRRFGIGFGG